MEKQNTKQSRGGRPCPSCCWAWGSLQGLEWPREGDGCSPGRHSPRPHYHSTPPGPGDGSLGCCGRLGQSRGAEQMTRAASLGDRDHSKALGVAGASLSSSRCGKGPGQGFLLLRPHIRCSLLRPRGVVCSGDGGKGGRTAPSPGHSGEPPATALRKPHPFDEGLGLTLSSWACVGRLVGSALSSRISK